MGDWVAINNQKSRIGFGVVQRNPSVNRQGRERRDIPIGL